MEKINRISSENKEQLENYHFKEMAEIEIAITSLIEQLKEKIENGEYDTLISDDTGGRIPALILRKIIKKHHPDKNIGTFFVASGKTYLPRPNQVEKYDQLCDHLKKITSETKKALIVTQFIFSGKTLFNLGKALKSVGINNFDIATVDSMPNPEDIDSLRCLLGSKNNLYIGSTEHHQLHEEHDKLSGVRKTKNYLPFPQRADSVIERDGRELSQEEWKEIFEIEEHESLKTLKEKTENPEKIAEFEKRTHAPITQEEKEEIQRNINLARKDIDLLVKKIINTVWNK